MKKKDDCNIFVMPPTITDEDVAALFNGIFNVMKRKTELEFRSHIINSNVAIERLKNELKSKTAECIRLKNEIVYLKSKLQQVEQNAELTWLNCSRMNEKPN